MNILLTFYRSWQKMLKSQKMLTLLRSFWCIYCQLRTNLTQCFEILVVDFEQINAGWKLRIKNLCFLCFYLQTFHKTSSFLYHYLLWVSNFSKVSKMLDLVSENSQVTEIQQVLFFIKIVIFYTFLQVTKQLINVRLCINSHKKSNEEKVPPSSKNMVSTI